MKGDGQNTVRLTDSEKTIIIDQFKASKTDTSAVKLIVLSAFIYAFAEEAAMFLMGHRIQNLLNDDIPTAQLFVCSFCTPVPVMTMTEAILYFIFTASVSKPVNNALLAIFRRILLKCMLHMGTACYMGLTACKSYFRRAKENWLPQLAAAILLTFFVKATHEVMKAPGAIMTAFINNVGNVCSRKGNVLYWAISIEKLEDAMLFIAVISIPILC